MGNKKRKIIFYKHIREPFFCGKSIVESLLRKANQAFRKLLTALTIIFINKNFKSFVRYNYLVVAVHQRFIKFTLILIFLQQRAG